MRPRWTRRLPAAPLEMHWAREAGLILVRDAGALTVFDGSGRDRWQTTAPRPLRHLAWVAETGALAGSADFGLVCLYDAAGQQRWRDGLVAHVGALAANGDGSRIVLACFTD